MASGRFSKQAAPFMGFGKALNNGNGDSVIGGAVTAAPSGLSVSQYNQNLPGDRIILSPSDALAYSNNSIGNLYTGTYRYVLTCTQAANGSTPTLGRAAFWNPNAAGNNNNSYAAADMLYQVTSDGNSSLGASTAKSWTLFAGVYINNITAGNYGWIQESGKASCQFRGAITGSLATGVGVYLASGIANNNNTDNGAFDTLAGANIGTAGVTALNFYASVDGMLTAYVGVAETLMSNNNLSLVDLYLSRASWRW